MKNNLLFTFLLLVPTSLLEAQAPSAHEAPGRVPTKLSVPASAMTGSLHHVEPTAYCDGLSVTYTVVATDGSSYEAVGTPILYQRIAEIYALEELRKMDSGEEYVKSLGNGAKNTVTAVGETISDPGKAISSVPKGVSKFFGSIGEGMKGGKSEYQEKAYSNVLGASKAKRSLAVQMGTNPYSTNKTFHAELNRVGWSEAGGTMTIHMATAAIPAGAGLALNLNRNVQAEVVENDPRQLAIINRKKLLEHGVDKEKADLLINHKWYSPVHETAITEALISLPPGHGQDVFLEVAARAENEVDANYFQLVAQLMEKYNRVENPVKDILRTGRTVSFRDERGYWVVPVPFDYCLWTASVQERAAGLVSNRKPEEKLVIYTTGTVSDPARSACQKEGIEVVERVSLE